MVSVVSTDAALSHPIRRTNMGLIKPTVLSCALAFTFGIAPLAHAASDSELAEIRAQIRELKDQYEARIKALEERLKSAEARAAEPAPAPAAAPVAGGAPSSISAFNP